jgi:peptide/nickel transport system substrate-binding protein
MEKKGLLGKVFYLGLVFSIMTSMLILGFTEAAEKSAPKPTTKAAPTLQPQYGGVLKIAEATGPTTPFGWPPEGVGEASVSGKPAIEALLRQHYDGRIEPWLATDYKIASDKKSVTFTLRKGVKFHDGTDFNAEAAKFNLEGMKAAKRPGTADWTSIDVVDDYTIRITLSQYSNIALTRFSGGGGAMVSPTAFKTKGIDWARWNPVGTGPFQFVSFERDVTTKYKKFNDYWQKGKPYLDGVELLYIKDPMTQSAAMQAGEVQVLNTDNGKMMADLKAMGLGVITADTGTVVLIPDSVNADSPLANKKVREAIEYAIDKEAIAKAKSYGFWVPAYQLPCPGTMAYVKNFQGRHYNPAKAKQLLTEAGYPNGFKTKMIPHFVIDRDVMVSIQAYLAKVGITVDLEFADQGKYNDYRRKGWNNGFMCQPFGMYPNYLQTIQTYLESKALDFPTLKKPAGGDDMLYEALSTINPEIPRVQKILKLFFDEVTVIPISTTGRAALVQKNVHDTGYLSLGMWTEWTPDKAWMSK